MAIQAARFQVGLRPRCTVDLLMPSASAILWQDQWGLPVLPRSARDARPHLGGRNARLAALAAWIEARDSVLLEARPPT